MQIKQKVYVRDRNCWKINDENCFAVYFIFYIYDTFYLTNVYYDVTNIMILL